MKLVITTQSELDAIKLDFNGEIVITGGTIGTPIKLKEYYPDAEVILSGNAVVSMYGKSQVNVMWESSQVKEMWGGSLSNWWPNSLNACRTIGITQDQ